MKRISSISIIINTITFSLLLIYSFGIKAQFTKLELDEFLKTATKDQLIEVNTTFSLQGIFNQAEKIADRLLELEPDNSNYNYRKGYALIYATLDYKKSEPYFQKAAENVTYNYDMLSVNEKRAPYEVYYHLGKVYHLSNDIDNAEYYYNKFLEKPPKKTHLIERTNLKLKQCKVARELLNTKGEKFVLESLGPTINSYNPEYAPVISLDGSALYFTTRRIRADSSNADVLEPGNNMHPEDIYVSYMDYDGNWGAPVLLDFCTVEQNEATAAVSTDERRIYVYKDHKGYGDIYYSDFQASKFSELKHLKTKGVNTNAWETHIAVTRDGNVKYFVSDREGGHGGRDIYRIERNKEGEWDEPKNIGPPINTKYNEDSPFIAVDNKTLYFASDSDKSMGGFDIFKSKLKSNGTWSEPENLGIPLNTAGDDIYYTTTADGLTGYIASFRPGGYGEKDIYRINNTHLGIKSLVGLKGEIETVDDKEIPEDVAYSVTCLNCDDGKYEIKLFPRISDKTYFANLLPCKTYEMTFHNQNGANVFYIDTFTTECKEVYTEIFRRIKLDVDNMEIIEPKDDIASFSPLEFKHLFGYNKNEINPEKGALKEFLESVKDQLTSGREDIELTINSSASKVTTRTYKDNQHLAQKRADNLKVLLTNYFKNYEEASIKIEINEVKVDGPDYLDKDYRSIDKYAPYQFVNIKLSGVNTLTNEVDIILSKDAELSDEIKIKTPDAKIVTDEGGDIFSSGTMIESEYQYHIVVGVFNRIYYANGLVESLKLKGFKDAQIIGKKNGHHVVAISSYNNLNDAKEMLLDVKRIVIDSAWILNSKK